MDNTKNVDDNMQLGIDNSKFNQFTQKNIWNKKIIQTLYLHDPTTNYMSVLIINILKILRKV